MTETSSPSMQPRSASSATAAMALTPATTSPWVTRNRVLISQTNVARPYAMNNANPNAFRNRCPPMAAWPPFSAAQSTVQLRTHGRVRRRRPAVVLRRDLYMALDGHDAGRGLGRPLRDSALVGGVHPAVQVRDAVLDLGPDAQR